MNLDRTGYDDGWGYSADLDAWVHEDSGIYFRRPSGMRADADGLAMTRAKLGEASGRIALDDERGHVMICADGTPDPIDDASLSAELDLRWHKFHVLDDGFVCLVDWMGSDDAVVQAARVSYGKDKRDGESQGDTRKLLRFMMRHHHTSPFEMCEVKLLVRCPMDVWRQWIRHRTASVNEYSTRYTKAIDSAQRTKPAEWRLQSKSNKQGSSGLLRDVEVTGVDYAAHLSRSESSLLDEARRVYEERLKLGIASEQARKDLPLSTYTEAYWKIDLHNLFHFLSKRMDKAAQLEIRSYANVIGHEIVAKLFPESWLAFLDYRLNAMTLSALEVEMLRAWLSERTDAPRRVAMIGDPHERMDPKREYDEFKAKLAKLVG